MAVQAEYASTNLIPFNLSAQEMKSSRGGDSLNQTQENNLSSRKRSRDRSNYFSLGQRIQPQPTKMVELSQLHNNVDHRQMNSSVSTGLKLCLEDQLQYQKNQHLHFNNPCPSNSVSSKEFCFYDQFKKESELIDKLITAQSEQLVRTLASKRLKHYHSVVSLVENSYGNVLKQKNAELQKAIRRNVELEQMTAQLSVSAQVWQRKAVAQESAATVLQAELLKATANGAGELMIHRQTVNEETDDAESVHMDPDRAEPALADVRLCRGCGSEVASVVLLPCRHLCLCTTCDVLCHACPCCRTVKQSSIEIYFS